MIRPVAREVLLACIVPTLIACVWMTAARGQAASPERPFEPDEAQRARFHALQSAGEHGLKPANYDVQALQALISSRDADTASLFAERLDAAFRRYATDISQGRLSPRADPDWHIPQHRAPVGTGASIADRTGRPPPHPDYARLHGAMIRYLAIRERGGWSAIPAGPKLSIGMLHPQVELARNRLRMTGDYTAMTPADPYLFDTGLDAATRIFQARHGLRRTGVIDETTREAMNVPVGERILQLSIAMERWRWLPRDLGHEYVWVNAADAMLELVVDGKPLLTMRTIVGHSTRPTPSLQSEIRRIVFNPAWSVPTTIATEDLLPKLRRDRDFLTRNRFRIYTGAPGGATPVDPQRIDWQNVNADRFPYRFVQQPGPANSLGQIKFVFDNPYDIYIHDTPAKGLFSVRTRTFSSGCVRLEQATGFADALLALDRSWTGADTRRYLDDDRTQGIDLQHAVPVYIVYITSWVTADGRAHFRRDLYRRDAPIAAAMRIDRGSFFAVNTNRRAKPARRYTPDLNDKHRRDHHDSGQ